MSIFESVENCASRVRREGGGAGGEGRERESEREREREGWGGGVWILSVSSDVRSLRKFFCNFSPLKFLLNLGDFEKFAYCALYLRHCPSFF
jgi:hypothetical protein